MLISTFATRLTEAIKIRNIKPADIVRQSELLFKENIINKPLTKPLISNYLKGSYEAKQDNVYSLSLILNVDEAWLMGYDVPMERKPTKVDSNVFPMQIEAVRVPVVGKISAGLPILAIENIVDYAFAPSTQIKSGYTYFYLIVDGDSMNRKFDNGDIILVQQQDTIENDEIGVFLIDDEATVKKYYEEDGIVLLKPMSTNPIHEPQQYNLKKVNFKIIGKVISYQGKV